MKSLYFCFLLASTSILLAQKPGTPDKTFGKEGRLWDTTAHYARYPALIVQPDDKILVGGQGFLKGSGIKTFRIDRLLKNGKPDYRFGDSGTVLVTFHLSRNEENHQASITCMALQPDGKIVAGGSYATKSSVQSDFIVMRFFSNGVIDSSFGIDGIAKPKIKGYTSSGNAMLVQPDGKIVIGGTYTPIFPDDLFFMERLMPNGNLDAGFGDSGQIIDNYGKVYTLALQPDNKIVAAGANGNSFDSAHFLIRRYLPDGTPDKRFGKKGTVDTAIGFQYSYISDLALQPDGKMVIAGGTYVRPGYPHFTVGRYNGNGSIDKSFGKGGLTVTLFSDDQGDASANAGKVMLWNDRIIAAGSRDAYNVANTNGSDVTMVAYHTDGTIDSGFAVNGIQNVNYDQKEYLASAALQSDGRIILLDLSQDFGQNYEVRNVLRYYGYPAQAFTNRSGMNSLPPVSLVLPAVHIYPNPAGEYCIVTGLNASKKTMLIISDGLGKTVAVYNAGGASQYRCDVSKLTTGVYYAHVITAGKTEVLNFIKE